MGKLKQSYKMSFSTGGLFLNESVEFARLYQAKKNWKESLSVALDDGLTSLPKNGSNRRTLREILNRLSVLTDDEVCFLVDSSDRQEQAFVLWLATCRAYRLVREYAVEVIRDQYLSYKLELHLESFDRLYEAKAEWDDELASLSKSTFLKVRQILFRMMKEASIISDDNQILTSYISPALRNLIINSNPDDLAIFPGVTLEGELAWVRQ